MAFDVPALRDRLSALAAGRAPRYRVAFSGGLDSSVLLAAAAEAFPGAVSAVHVDHGLHPDSPAWADHCRARCEALGVPCTVLGADASPARGESPESAARAARYGALRSALAPGDVLLLAHHADDQLETVLMQLLRGAGPAGLAGMPGRAAFAPGEMWRPLLGFPRADLEAWARARGLAWLEDPANRDTRLSRNHLRHEVLPPLKAHWPAAAAAAGRSARHCAEAAGLLDDLGALDAARLGAGDGLPVRGLLALSPARRANVLRHCLRRLGLPLPDHRRLGTLLAQLECAGPGAAPRVAWPGAVAACHGERLYLLPAGAVARPPAGLLDWPDPTRPLAVAGGTLATRETRDGGLDPAALDAGAWTVAFRRGGERIRLPGRRHRSELKKLFHAAGVPPWERARTPLVLVDGRLAAVGGRWVAAEWWSPPGNKALRLTWENRP